VEQPPLLGFDTDCSVKAVDIPIPRLISLQW